MKNSMVTAVIPRQLFASNVKRMRLDCGGGGLGAVGDSLPLQATISRHREPASTAPQRILTLESTPHV